MNVITNEKLNVPYPSAAWMGQVKTSLNGFVGKRNPLAALLYDESGPGRHAGHQIWSVGLRSIATLQNLDDQAVKPFCWRFLAGGHRSISTAAGCWVADGLTTGAAPSVMAVFQGPETAELLHGTERLNALKELNESEYDLRVLRVPALYLEAFWLKGKSGASDLIIPYGLIIGGTHSEYVKLSGGGKLKKDKVYPAAEFLKIIRAVAQRRLATADISPAARPHQTAHPPHV